MVHSTNKFPDYVDNLVGFLLSNGDSRPTDGILFEKLKMSPYQASGIGIVIMIEGQTVEPLSVSLTLNPSKTEIQSGQLCFGNKKRDNILYGSSRHKKLIRKLMARPGREFSPNYTFLREDKGWHLEKEPSSWREHGS